MKSYKRSCLQHADLRKEVDSYLEQISLKVWLGSANINTSQSDHNHNMLIIEAEP
jgi:hypothetical protein